MRAYLKYLSVPVFTLVMIVGSSALVGCNTTEGAGRDIESLGDKIEDAAD